MIDVRANEWREEMKKTVQKAGAAVVVCLLASVILLAGGEKTSAEAKANNKIKSFKATASKKTLYLGWKKSKKTASIKVKIQPKKASKKVSCKSSNKKVVKVSAKGKVTAVKPGKATVTVTSKAQKKFKSKIKFTVKNYPMAFARESVSVTLEGKADVTEKQLTLYGTDKAVTFTSDNKEVATVTKTGKIKAKKLGTAVITAKNKKGKKSTCTVKVIHSTQAIHDPSVFRDPQSGKYYTFGSHLMAATSTNLIGWSAAANSSTNYAKKSTLFSKRYTKEFAKAYAYTMPDGASQNAWAPDVIYNPSMHKYCMYMSIVDGTTKCCIALATADKPDGPYTYQDMIVCSGMNTDGSDIDKTNVAKALGISDAQAKASKYVTLGTDSPDAIDATVFYDHNGNLWMVYGSFTTTGGIRLLKLDPASGLRGENYADSGDGGEKGLSTDDPYYGKKIANSNGEGPFIQMLPNPNSSTGYYYYLWTSVGNLQNYGGYNMRVVRAENPEGPYYDPEGNEAVKDRQKYALGMRVMDNYKFSFMKDAFVSQGGNSAVDDGNGKTFIQFHTRTESSDSYTFRVHQTFMNEDGWLVTAPYEYNGETIADSYDKSAVAGDYEFIYHRTSFAKTTQKNMDVQRAERLTLQEDGTVTGAYKGSWSLQGHNVTIQINEQTYKGVVLEQYEQTNARQKVMVFTAAGSDNRTIWGSKMHKSDAEAAAYDAGSALLPEQAYWDFALPESGLYGSSISWTSDNSLIQPEGSKAKVEAGDKEVTVTLTATAKKGSQTKTKTYTVKVPKGELRIDTVVRSDKIDLPASYRGVSISWSSSDTSVIAADGKVVQPESGYRKVTLTAQTVNDKKTFDVVVLPKSLGTAIYEEDYSTMVSDTAIATRWTSKDKQNCLYVESDATHDSFIKFAAGRTGSSQGAQTLFGVADKAKDVYTVTFDVALEAGSNDTTEFALTGTDVKYKENDTNAGLESGYICKLSAKDSLVWHINDSEKGFELPVGWVTVTAVVDTNAKKAAVCIADDENIYYGGEVSVSGNGKPNGLYLRWARMQSLISVDNVGVYQ